MAMARRRGSYPAGSGWVMAAVCKVRRLRPAKRAQVFRGNASSAVKPSWNGRDSTPAACGRGEAWTGGTATLRSEERCVGKECIRTVSLPFYRYLYTQQNVETRERIET